MIWPRIDRIAGGGSVYLIRVHLLTFGRRGGLYLHIFNRPDADPDPHDHPWAFWTFPLRSYCEFVHEQRTEPSSPPVASVIGRQNVVRAFRLHHRPAGYTHRVTGWRGRGNSARLWTIVWHGRVVRKWGFYPLTLDGIPPSELKFRRPFMPWRDYIAQRGREPLP